MSPRSEAETFVMPFGRHQGKPLDQVPAGYLVWVLENITGMWPETRQAIASFLGIEPLLPPAAGGSQEAQEQQAAPRRPAQRRPRTPAPDASAELARCGICGRPGTAEQPLVHERCRDDEVPF